MTRSHPKVNYTKKPSLNQCQLRYFKKKNKFEFYYLWKYKTIYNGQSIRCGWCLSSDLYKEYHDQEWGTPVYDDATLFEFLI
jgi:hypothetical protein